MRGLFVAFGLTAKARVCAESVSKWMGCRHDQIGCLENDDGVFVAVIGADRKVLERQLLRGGHHETALAVDDYVFVASGTAALPHIDGLRTLANTIRDKDVEEGLRTIVAGSFNLVVLDGLRGTCCVVSDPMGSIPLYHGPLEDGWIFSTSPVALASTGLVDSTLDATACASWTFAGYTIGDRYFLKGLRCFPPASIFRWDKRRQTGAIEKAPFDPYAVIPRYEKPDTGRLVAAFGRSCERLCTLHSRTVNLQSAGMDSRLILAAYPGGKELSCYTYGNPDSAEVAIAEAVAAVRGSSFVHFLPDGDRVAEVLDRMFAASGLLVYPDRYLIAQRVSEDGFTQVLDGFAGGSLLGGQFFTCDRYFSFRSRLARFVTKLIDERVSRIGLDNIASAVLDDITELRDLGWLSGYIAPSFLEVMERQREEVLQDVYREIERLVPDNDSVALLFRNFKWSNRNAHAILQQGVMCRQFLSVGYPFSSDYQFLKLALGIEPAAAAYGRLYVQIFKKHFPAYGRIRSGFSMLPVRRSAFAHKWSKILLAKGLPVPLITGAAKGRTLDPNNWQRWLRTSQTLRDKVVSMLQEGGIHDSQLISGKMRAVGGGGERGSGKLLHMAAIARWVSMSR